MRVIGMVRVVGEAGKRFSYVRGAGQRAFKERQAVFFCSLPLMATFLVALGSVSALAQDTFITKENAVKGAGTRDGSAGTMGLS